MKYTEFLDAWVKAEAGVEDDAEIFIVAGDPFKGVSTWTEVRDVKVSAAGDLLIVTD